MPLTFVEQPIGLSSLWNDLQLKSTFIKNMLVKTEAEPGKDAELSSFIQGHVFNLTMVSPLIKG